MPRLLSVLAALLAGVLLLGVPVHAVASTTPSPGPSGTQDGCAQPSVADAAKDARAVFTGEVLGAEREATGSGVEFLHEVRVTRVYRGRIDTETIEVRTSATGTCPLGRLTDGTAYVFFAAAGEPPWLARDNGGTARATEELVTRVEQALGAGRAPVGPEPESAEFTDVDTTGPAGFSQLAAPGLALMLVGLLGLALVGLLRRRR